MGWLIVDLQNACRCFLNKEWGAVRHDTQALATVFWTLAPAKVQRSLPI